MPAWAALTFVLIAAGLAFVAGSLWASPSDCAERLATCQIQYRACQDQDD